jgi:hypothetical protein
MPNTRSAYDKIVSDGKIGVRRVINAFSCLGKCAGSKDLFSDSFGAGQPAKVPIRERKVTGLPVSARDSRK